MILDRFVLQDFGLYGGRQVIELAPHSRKKPIVLIGAMNGGGKTTFLDALQLALYGKLAQCSNRGELAYDEFLHRSVHRSKEAEGAALELDFSHTAEGEKHNFQIRRSWTNRDRRERLEVHHGGGLDSVLTESWAEHIEGILPLRLSRFFFFDGEKIEALADLERSREVLSTAIHSLLGLDLVDQISTDLLVLERRKRAELKNEVEREELARIDREIARLEAKQADLVQERGAAQNAIDRATKRLREAEDRYQKAGGDAFEKRKEIESKRAAQDERLRILEDELREIAAGPAPLMLVADLLDVVAADAEAERASVQAQGLTELLTNRDKKVLDTARKAGAGDKVIAALRAFLEADLDRHARARTEGHYLELSTEGHSALTTVRMWFGEETTDRIRHRIAQADRLEVEIEDLDRRLERAPAQDAIAKLAAERTEAQTALDQAHRALRELEETAERVNRELITFTRRKKEALETTVDQERWSRMLVRSEQMRQAFTRFRGTVVQRHVSRLEELILDSFQQILRKNSLISGLRIDPESFALTLLGSDRRELSPERLSAGERQLLAISTIWGLARASGRPLPVVIDTPLGRLDSVHRDLLVERYFPNASHQVILLSTDEEIDEKLYAKLEPYISHKYRLEYDDRTGSTKVVDGYFW